MTEATHTSEGIYGLWKAIGRGARLWAGNITIAADLDTLDTGMDTVEGISSMFVSDAAVDANTPIVAISDLTGGTLTFQTGKLGDYAAVAATGYIMVVGTVR